MDFIFGAAFLFLKPEHQIPLAVGSIIVRGIQRIRHRNKKPKKPEISTAPHAENSITLQWNNLTCTLQQQVNESRNFQQRILLDNLHGEAKPGRLLAICGPSGSGKTTLLNSLAGQLPYDKRLSLEGHLAYLSGNTPVPPSHIRSGFVAQEDLFYSQLTVRETLLMTAELRATTPSTAQERQATVDNIIRRLGLAKCADSLIGDAKTRGLSGGEKKRLSIACELVAAPQLIMADEPTSGLDAFGAQQVMQTLKDLASAGHTVCASVHQPRSSIFAMFDDLCLLAEGKLLYFGPAADAIEHFSGLGYPCPEHYNPAEFLADLVAIDHSTKESEIESTERVEKLAMAWREGSADKLLDGPSPGDGVDDCASPGGGGGGVSSACGLGRQVALLFGRSLKQILRDKATIASRASSQLSSAAVFSAIYFRMDRSQASIQDRLGLLQVAAVGTAMTSLIKTLNAFPKERTLVTRERSRAAYPVMPYLLSKLAAELPVGALFPAVFGSVVYPMTGLRSNVGNFFRFLGILTAESFSAQALGLAVGAAAPSTEAALAIGPAVILVSIVFGGLFVNEKNVPLGLSWAPRTSLIKHAFEGACINELEGESFDPDENGRGERNGDEVLSRLGFKGRRVNDTILSQGRIMMFYWWITYCILERKKPKYVELKSPRHRQTSLTSSSP